MVGPEYEFLYVDVGRNGRNSDGGIWSRCPLKNALEKNALNIPEPRALPGRLNKTPYVCTGDDAFPLSLYMMKPFPQINLTKEKRIFNYRLSRMRRISENGFGILANKWRVFCRPFSLEPEKVKIVTLAAITLHNWLRSESKIGKFYIPVGLTDRENIETGEFFEGTWRSDKYQGTWYPIQNSLHANRSSNLAREVRDEFTEYFMNEGCVPWQWKSAKIDI